MTQRVPGAVCRSEISLDTDPALIEDNTEMPHGMAVNKAGTQVLRSTFITAARSTAFSVFKVSLTSETKLTGNPSRWPASQRS